MHVANLHGVSLVLSKSSLSLRAWHIAGRVRVCEPDFRTVSATREPGHHGGVAQEVLYVWSCSLSVLGLEEREHGRAGIGRKKSPNSLPRTRQSV
jgi:hypothetical protein